MMSKSFQCTVNEARWVGELSRACGDHGAKLLVLDQPLDFCKTRLGLSARHLVTCSRMTGCDVSANPDGLEV